MDIESVIAKCIKGIEVVDKYINSPIEPFMQTLSLGLECPCFSADFSDLSTFKEFLMAAAAVGFTGPFTPILAENKRYFHFILWNEEPEEPYIHVHVDAPVYEAFTAESKKPLEVME